MNNKLERKDYWDDVYKNKLPNQVSWYEEFPVVSFDMIEASGVGPDANIIDVGGGASNLVDNLLSNGYRRITVLDVAPLSIDKAKERLKGKAGSVKWLEADITEVKLTEDYDVWHDRAVFHFLTNADDRKRYVSAVRQSLKIGGHLIISTFSVDGPMKCSGLDVVRYSPQTLSSEFGDDFQLIESSHVEHITPAKVVQRFIFCRFKRVR
ncbi:class I SAM-dependent methyltransferase [Candidatus Magnetominusculus xianensis]|uniref:Methyltransferase n=1 Tax=Candidatus Magnetominusculus xianensis TaxID=1748249 RepID=A0ABR5SGN0_9BACT|nr:class I SAM-dependent methyltransferase [Candidatus Magnetominusculus xianensis]KWT90157.1 methyltransferase [Candidatus Magnetominusculus xianensis]MBF0403650.1 class I SAM-dependent methyltransferase [Nitrospirota bacterium]